MATTIATKATRMMMKRTGIVGGPIQREDGTHGTTQQAFPGGA
jgi:hypothetical protein